MVQAGDLLDVLKGNRKFWARRAINALAALSGVFLVSSPEFTVRLIAGLTFVVTGSVTGALFVQNWLAQPVMFSLKHEHRARFAEEADFRWLAKMMKISGDKLSFRLVPGLANAYSNILKRTVYYGDVLYSTQSREERLVTMVHELGHFQLSKKFKALCLSLLLVVLFHAAGLAYLRVDFLITTLIQMGLLELVFTYSSWLAEFKADQAACECLGPRAVVRMLDGLVSPSRRGLHSETHPSIETRIRRIKKAWRLNDVPP